MNPIDRLNNYLRQLEARMRLAALTRGGALTLAVAAAATLLLVLLMNALSFSGVIVQWSRVALFLALAVALAFGIVIPLLRLNRKRAARRAEQRFPQFNERLLTLAERHDEAANPFLELLAADAMDVASNAEPKSVVPRGVIFGSVTAGAAALGVLLWLTLAAPGFLGHGASLLWAGTPRVAAPQTLYDIRIDPGDRKVRRGSDQLITATPVGFEPSSARLFARYAAASQWEPVAMQPQPNGPGFQFLFAGLAENVEYYVESRGVRSRTHQLSIVDLPGVKRIKVTYHYPKWTSLPVSVEDPGGDLRAVEGTEADVEVTFDRPLGQGALMLDSGSRIALAGGGLTLTARVPINRDGMYYVAALDGSDVVRLSEDYFIEARKETPPVVRLRRPGRDAKVLPVEEVTMEVEAEDDFGVEGLDLTYSVNGAPEKTVSLLKRKGGKQVSGSTVLALEDYKLSPGDIVTFYASARDARSTTKTDIYFIEAQAYEREYTQSQQAGGGAGGPGQDAPEISARQKEIIAATWNQLKGKHDQSGEAGDARFLSDVQGKLRDQARSLANRMKSRELSRENAEFQQVTHSLEAASQAMGEAVDQLKGRLWKEALQPEQRALQNLLRAEASFRQIQVAFGSRGQGGSSGGAGRDLESLFDLELDTEKNQYETGQQLRSPDQRAKELEEAMQKLADLARRQQELSRQNQNQQTFQQRWQQEMLRREAEQLQRRMEQLTRGGSSSSSSSQQAQQQQQQQQQGGRQGAQSAGRQSGRQQSSGSAGASSPIDPKIERALDQLRKATEEMGRATRPENSGEGRRAAERLAEAQDMLKGLRRQETSQQMDDLKRRADELARGQRAFEDRLKQTYGERASLQPGQGINRGPSPSQLAGEKQRLQEDLERLERDLQRGVREMQNSQRAAANKLRQALGEMQQNELGLRMKMNSEYIRRGYGPAVVNREAPLTQGLERLARQVGEAAGALNRDPGNEGKDQAADAVNRLERMRGQLQQMARSAAPGSAAPPSSSGQSGPGAGVRSHGGGSNDYGGARYSAMDTGDRQFADPTTGAYDSEAAARAYRDALRELSQLRQSLPGENAESARDLQSLIQEMQRLDPRRFPGNPELINRMLTTVIPSMEQLELQLRRQSGDKQSGDVRTGASDKVPPGYAGAVAEYFRKLSQGKN